VAALAVLGLLSIQLQAVVTAVTAVMDVGVEVEALV
jgi:hypothetical protein